MTRSRSVDSLGGAPREADPAGGRSRSPTWGVDRPDLGDPGGVPEGPKTVKMDPDGGTMANRVKSENTPFLGFFPDFPGVPLGTLPGAKKCTFRRVFNNSPSRDRCLPKVFVKRFWKSGFLAPGRPGTRFRGSEIPPRNPPFSGPRRDRFSTPETQNSGKLELWETFQKLTFWTLQEATGQVQMPARRATTRP